MSDATPPSRPVRKGDHVFLVDGSSYIFRAYHALPPLTRKSDALPVGAVAGFCNMLWKLLREAEDTPVGVKPTHLAVVFDASAVSFRNSLYDAYKAQRPEPPEDLKPQFGLIRQAVAAFNVPAVEQDNYEADDIIATYTRQAVEAGADVTIVASDKDLMQLVGPGVVMLDTMKDRRIGPEEVMEKFGVPPEKVIDVQALAGDSIDNVPGVPGIGVKTAASLITEFGDLETLLANAGTIKQPKRREALIENADKARLSKRLVTLENNVPLEVPIDQLGVRPLEGPRLVGFLKALEFTTLTRRVAAATNTNADSIPPARVRIRHWPPGMGDGEPAGEDEDTAVEASAPAVPAGNPAALAERVATAVRAVSFQVEAYQALTGLEALDACIREAFEHGVVAIDVVTSGPDVMQAEIIGVALALKPNRAFYVPLGHCDPGAGDLLEAVPLPNQIQHAAAIARLKPLLESPSVLKVGHNLKQEVSALARYGISMAPIDDIMLISYALDAGRSRHGGHSLEDLAEEHLGHRPIAMKELTGSGRAALPFARVPLERATEYAAEAVDLSLRLWRLLKARLPAERRVTVYEALERPLVAVLARMEARGIRVDRERLSRLSGDFAQSMAAIEEEIYELAGERFAIGSPKQLGDILFGKLGLPGAKRTAKSGAWATGADVLEELAAQGYKLAQRVLDWRLLAKLKSTYADLLPTFINPATGRIHTSYALAATPTGRLSSSDPNLQNIPVRTEEGRKIRAAFLADPGFRLVSADYSQIELRVLAHIADVPALRKAFEDGLDIHAMTASEMFSVPIRDMDPMIRRRAKAINFGIIYGISAFGLANQLGIPREEAAEYIRRYFERFPGIRDYMESTKAFCREHGYVETIFGRRCHYPEIRSSNPQMRAFTERQAINAPIQGSAADIIRRAMIRMEPALDEAHLNAAMLLQVHDELVFEVPEEEVPQTLPLITRVMEEAALPAVELKVPLKVDARAADNWEEAH